MLNKKYYPVLALLLLGILLLNRIALLFDQSEDLGGIESVFVYYVMQVMSGNTLYPALNHPPFGDCQYAPIYFESAGNLLAPFFIDNELLFRKLYPWLRLGNLLFHLLTVWLLLSVVRGKQVITKTQTLFAVVLLLALFHSHQVAVRPDALKTLLITLAFVFFLKMISASSVSIISLFGFALAAALAGLVKQDALLWAGVFCTVGFFVHQKKTWFMAAGLTAFLLLVFLTGFYVRYGAEFGNQLLLGFRFNYSWDYFLSEVFWPAWPLLLLQIVALLVLLLFSFKEYALPAGTLLLGGCCITPVAFKWGATPVYYQEMILWTAALVLQAVFGQPAKEQIQKYPVYLLGLILAFWWSGQWPVYDWRNQKEQQSIHREREILSQSLTKKYGADGFYLFTHDRSLIGMNHRQALFPTFETTHPEFLMNGLHYGNNRYPWRAAFPNLPDFELTDSVLMANQTMDRKVIAVVPGGKPIPAFAFIHPTNFLLVRKTTHFDLYESILP